MSLQNYVLNGPSTVVKADRRDPAVSWDRHVRNSGRGGVDLVAPKGTDVLAPTDGVFTHVPDNGTAGNSSVLAHDDNQGWSDVFSHLSAYVAANGAHVRRGEVIARSGDTGVPGQPHLHRHLLNPWGTRENPWIHFGSARTIRAAAAIRRDEEDEMITRELVSPIDGPGIYFSVNRLERYPIHDTAMLEDYVFHLRQIATAGDRWLLSRGAEAFAVAEVKSIESFGAITLDQVPSTLVVTSDDLDRIDENARNRLGDAPVDLAPVLAAIAGDDDAVIEELRTGLAASDTRRGRAPIG